MKSSNKITYARVSIVDASMKHAPHSLAAARVCGADCRGTFGSSDTVVIVTSLQVVEEGVAVAEVMVVVPWSGAG